MILMNLGADDVFSDAKFNDMGVLFLNIRAAVYFPVLIKTLLLYKLTFIHDLYYYLPVLLLV